MRAMAIDCKSPGTPYEEEVKTVLDSLVVNRIKGVALDRWQQDGDVKTSGEDQEGTEIDIPAHQDDQPELHASDISNVTEDLLELEESFSALNSSMRVGRGMHLSGDSLQASMNTSMNASLNASMASFADSSAFEQTSKASTKAERKRRKRLNKKKNKYSQMLSTSTSDKNGFTLADLINEEKGAKAEQTPENNDLFHQSYPEPEKSKDGCTLLDLVTDLQTEEKGQKMDTAGDCESNDESSSAPRGSRSNSRKTSGKNSDEEAEKERANEKSSFAPRGSRSSNAGKKSTGKLPRRSKTMDDSDRQSFQARRDSLLNDEETQNSANAGNHGKGKRFSRRHMDKSAPGKKVLLDGLAAISAHASTEADPTKIGRKVKLKRAMSDLGKKVERVLPTPNSPVNTSAENSPVSTRSDRRRNIKQAFACLGKSQRLMEEKGKSPVPVRMPSRRSLAPGLAPARLPTTAVASRISGTKLGAVAAAAGIQIPKASHSFSSRRPAKKINTDELTGSVHGTSTTCASSRRARAADFSKSVANLSVEDLDLDFPPVRHSCGSKTKTSSSTDDEMSKSVRGTSSTRETPRRDRRSKAAAATGSADFDWKKFSTKPSL